MWFCSTPLQDPHFESVVGSRNVFLRSQNMSAGNEKVLYLLDKQNISLIVHNSRKRGNTDRMNTMDELARIGKWNTPSLNVTAEVRKTTQEK